MLLSWATFSFKWFYLFIFGRAGSPLPHGLFSSSGGQGLLSTCRRVGFSLWGLLLFWSMDSRVHRLQQFSTWAQQLWLPGSRAQAQQLWRTDLEAPWHAGSSWIRDQTHVSCIGRWILYHWATREALEGAVEERAEYLHGCQNHSFNYATWESCLVSPSLLSLWPNPLVYS